MARVSGTEKNKNRKKPYAPHSNSVTQQRYLLKNLEEQLVMVIGLSGVQFGL